MIVPVALKTPFHCAAQNSDRHRVKCQQATTSRLLCLVFASFFSGVGLIQAQTSAPRVEGPARIVRAEIAALDQLLVYNRFGAFNPYGMIFALRRDVVAASNSADRTRGMPDADECKNDLADAVGVSAATLANALDDRSRTIRLRDCKRPRPLVLRGMVGDILEIEVTNLLHRQQPDLSGTYENEKAKSTKSTKSPKWCAEHRAYPTKRTDIQVAPNRPEVNGAYAPLCVFEQIETLLALKSDYEAEAKRLENILTQNPPTTEAEAHKLALHIDDLKLKHPGVPPKNDKTGKKAEPYSDIAALLEYPIGPAGTSSLIELWREWHLAVSEKERDETAAKLDAIIRHYDKTHGPSNPDGNGAFADALEALAVLLRKPDYDRDNPDGDGKGKEQPGTADWPRTRTLSISVPGLEPEPDAGNKVEKACLGLDAVAPGKTLVCRFRLAQEGTHVLSSLAAPAGGEGDAGSLIQGLFAAIIIEPKGAVAYRSQVTSAVFDKAWSKVGPKDLEGISKPNPGFVLHGRKGGISYEATSDKARGGCSTVARPSGLGMPLLNMHRDCGTDSRGHRVIEIVHADLNAIIVPDPVEAKVLFDRYYSENPPTLDDERTAKRLANQAATPFREFSTIFHDEMKTFYPRHLDELRRFGQLSGVRDGFGINYGASGAGAMVIANRKGIGPAANCPECLYEEFFLESWANGDPALLEAFPDDPSNVHHSYLNDKTVFRAFHVGKETHVFHLHAHQWFAGNDENRGSYLDSQTIGPQQGMSYRIYQGGTDRYAPEDPGDKTNQGVWSILGSGNRNRTPGDAIFHCHLYPHFAQGMWALWRVHDVLEDGSRVLPDGQKQPGLSVTIRSVEERLKTRSGSVDRVTGRWLGNGKENGTPIPAIVPIPGQATPVLPSYADEATNTEQAVVGYPFFMPGLPGHRAPQPPLDMATAKPNDPANEGRPYLDGGLPRHVISGGLALPNVATPAERKSALDKKPPLIPVARMLALGDITSEFLHLSLETLPQTGTPLERAAMRFHADGQGLTLLAPQVTAASPPEAEQKIGYATFVPELRKAAVKPAAVKPADKTAAQAPATAASGTPVPPMTASERITSFEPKPIQPRVFAVNGAPAAPGAPFADPCAVSSGFRGTQFRRFDGDKGFFTQLSTFGLIRDPLRSDGTEFVPDPGLTGFRRFDGSAVEFDMVVNRAGWHDPQARVNVLSSVAHDVKGQKRADIEPFFFRAFSGECIEFRHTNELPKDLELDDFQLRVPTDTIGQHIHLVKFDVTSADGSGNGFNYEDGTFAPDEIMARICASRGADRHTVFPGREPAKATPAELADWHKQGLMPAERKELCEKIEAAHAIADPKERAEELKKYKVYKKNRLGPDGNLDIANGRYFQTTVQRWFADPILSNDGQGGVADRTLRTVFTHDHFGPSNIQQHGFYAALIIEPQKQKVCGFDGPEDKNGQSAGYLKDGQPAPGIKRPDSCVAAPTIIADGGNWPADIAKVATDEQHNLVGVRARVFTPSGNGGYGHPIHPDAREYAIAIADFALLYDGSKAGKVETEERCETAEGHAITDRECAEKRADPSRTSVKGMARLVADAASLFAAPCLPPYKAVAADAKPCGITKLQFKHVVTDNEAPAHDATILHLPQQTAALKHGEGYLKHHATEWRANHGNPVAPPLRPEAISQKHHDPYLVNYRNEPIPLRAGTHASNSESMDEKRPDFASRSCLEGVASRDYQSINAQLRGDSRDYGDLSNVFRSFWPHPFNRSKDQAGDNPGPEIRGHGDPCTPTLEMLAHERLSIRLIQGAHEVQHTFMIDGRVLQRNADQAFPTARPLASRQGLQTRDMACLESYAARSGRPRQFIDWVTKGTAEVDQSFWPLYQEALAGCTNLRGHITAQEIGISEHFEFKDLMGVASQPETKTINRLPAIVSSLAAPAARISAVQPGLPFKNDDVEAPTGKKGDDGAIKPNLRSATIGKIPEPDDLNFSDQNSARYLINGEQNSARDLLYSFGSQDALWNGAWGLVRIHDNDHPLTPDLTRCLLDPKAVAECSRGGLNSSDPGLPIRTRLASLTSDQIRGSGAAVPASGSTAAPKPQDELPPRIVVPHGQTCPTDAPRMNAAVIAVRAADVLKKEDKDGKALDRVMAGLPYDHRDGYRLFDPDAMLLLPLALDELGISLDDFGKAPPSTMQPSGPPIKSGFLEIGKTWPDIQKILQARFKTAASAPPPFVLRANAGDCVRLLMINGLTLRGGTNDAPGDAPQPKIVPLNVDRSLTRDGTGTLRELKPSARFSVSLPIQLGAIRWAAGYPAGANLFDALSPVGTECEIVHRWNTSDFNACVEKRTKSGLRINTYDSTLFKGKQPSIPSTYDILEFYTGYMSADSKKLEKEIEASISNTSTEFCSESHKNFTAIPKFIDPLDPNQCMGTDSARLVLYGTNFCIKNDDSQKMSRIACLLRKNEQAFLRTIPHGFGAFPIRATGDTISHTSHGMLGTLVIESSGAQYATRGELKHDGTCAELNMITPERANAGEPTKNPHATIGAFCDRFKASPDVAVAADPFAVRTPLSITRPRLGQLNLAEVTIKEHVLAYQDGLNLWSRLWGGGAHLNFPSEGVRAKRWEADRWLYALPNGGFPSGNGELARDIDRVPLRYGHPLPDCPVCDDTYDFGEKGVSYRTAPFTRRLANWYRAKGDKHAVPHSLGLVGYPDMDDEHDLNRFVFPPKFFDHGSETVRRVPGPRLAAYAGEEMMIRVVHPSGRARQRAFLMHGAPYDDLMPGFGSPHSGLLAPGKSMNAGFCAPRVAERYLWRDGPQHIFAAGVWGHIEVSNRPSNAPSSALCQDIEPPK